MDTKRRELLLGTLFGGGYAGLRALATGLPLAAFTRPLHAVAQELAACADKNKAQYLILSTSSAGDPLNANVPGTYETPEIIHSLAPQMTGVPLSLGGKVHTGARIWSALPQTVLDRTLFFHHGTYTNNHPNLPKVLRLMGATAKDEMLPSVIAKELAPCLGTVQTEPISVGAGDILSFEGRGLPNLPPIGLRDTLAQPAGALKNLQKLRDSGLDRMHAFLKQNGTKQQQSYLDALANSRRQARSLSEDLLSMLSDITSNRADGQITAAVALIKMNVSPVITIRIDFGGDNHTDPDLTRAEVPQGELGVQQIAALMAALKTAGLEDKVTFAMYNVFGRTLKKLGTKGRDHWASHHATVMIGKAIKAGVIGGLEPKAGDFYATPIDSKTGRGVPGGGDIAFNQTLASMGKTLGTAVGVSAAALNINISEGKVVPAALV